MEPVCSSNMQILILMPCSRNQQKWWPWFIRNVALISSESQIRSDCLPVPSWHHSFGTYTICGSLITWVFFHQTDISGCFRFLLSGVAEVRISADTWCSSLMYSDSVHSSLARGWAAAPQETFSCWYLAAECWEADEHLHWSHLAAFAWWGFIALKMPKNVSQLTFSVREWVHVSLSSFPQNKLYLLPPSGRKAPTETNKGSFSFLLVILNPTSGSTKKVLPECVCVCFS